MPLRLSELATGVHAETLAAVVLGAVVATASGMVANVWEARVRERQRERVAALLVGEAIAAMRTILEATLQSLEVGERFGQITRRMLIAARHELDIYERNREVLLDLRDARLRTDLHTLMVRIAMPLDGVIASLGDPSPDSPAAREAGIEFMRETLTRFPSIIERLARVAGTPFSDFQDVFLAPQVPSSGGGEAPTTS